MTQPDAPLRTNIEIQRGYNLCHRDGSLEKPNEAAIGYAEHMCLLAKQYHSSDELSFLDVGCRTGYAMDIIADIFPRARVVGVDIVPEFVEIALQRQDEVLLASADSLPFADGEFDWVFASHVLEHCVDMPKAIREICRVARTGCYVAVPLEPASQKFRDSNPSHHWFIDDSMTWLNLFASQAHGKRLFFSQVIPPQNFNFAFLHWELKELI